MALFTQKDKINVPSCQIYYPTSLKWWSLKQSVHFSSSSLIFFCSSFPDCKECTDVQRTQTYLLVESVRNLSRVRSWGLLSNALSVINSEDFGQAIDFGMKNRIKPDRLLWVSIKSIPDPLSKNYINLLSTKVDKISCEVIAYIDKQGLKKCMTKCKIFFKYLAIFRLY